MPLSRQGISELPEICFEHGIRNVVLSSGSRNAPLMIAFASHFGFRCHSITDERSAAYFALGMAQQLKKPVVLVSTSGTASVNYAPALAEALHLKVPLLVLTADRPAEWIDQNDGQTIRQRNLFSNIVKRSFQLPFDTERDDDLWFFRRSINEAVLYCTLDNSGPVHVNVPLNEPLYNSLPTVEKPLSTIKLLASNRDLTEESWSLIIDKWKSFRNKMIVCGLSSFKDELLQESLNKLASSNEAVVIAENLSNLSGDKLIDTPEQFMASVESNSMSELQPDLLVTIGGSIISKRLKKYLRQFKPIEHWHVDENDIFIDTFQSLTHNLRVNPHVFVDKVVGVGLPNDKYSNFAYSIQNSIAQLRDSFISNAEYSDLVVWQKIFDQLPESINLHLANSTPVRYSQLFDTKKDISYFSNRGTSGIDGCLSTAIGAASVSNKINVLLLGDLAFVYDSNGFWNNSLPDNIRVIVVDNGGGNIFQLIESGPEVVKISKFIVSPHKVKIEDLCKAYGIDYCFADSLHSLTQILPQFFKPKDKPIVLHVKTSGDISAKVFKEYFKELKNINYEKRMEST